MSKPPRTALAVTALALPGMANPPMSGRQHQCSEKTTSQHWKVYNIQDGQFFTSPWHRTNTTSITIQIPKAMQYKHIVPDLLICACIDGVLAIGRDINFLHAEPLHEVVRMHSRVFNYLSFLKTDASTKELAWLATRQHEKNVLWMLAEPTISPKCWSFIHILAIATAEAVAAIEARGLGYMNLDRGIRDLRWRLQDIRKEAQDKRKIPELRELIIKDGDGNWRVASSEEPSIPNITTRASAEQMLWLSQYLSFSPILRALQEQFNTTEVGIHNFFALEAAVNIGAFRHTLGDWLEGVDVFIHELECMLIEGVVIPEI
jgi:hypothetical protein